MTKVLVIGAAGGIGMEVARQLVAQGDSVVATVMDAAQEAQLRGEVPGVAGVELLALDDAEAVLVRVQQIVAAMGGVDQVAVCAAVGPLGPCELTPLADYAKAMSVNFLSNVAIFQAVLPALRQAKGRLLLISSMGGKVALPFVGAYTASKHAIEGFADVARQEIAADGVDLVLVEPGGVRTGMVSAQIAWTKEAFGKLDAGQAARYGALYHGFAAAAQAGYDGAGSTPDQVATVIVAALAAEKPETRYVVGGDAQQLLGARAALSDREMDATLAAFFGGAG
ncbi:MAG: SDR family NAD(P)-dependent oxidoreductase [Sphingomonadales bacterium]|nr:SDR family NAD(P)-dependent oxidoreductase [Sphingomonadales bacterium]